MIEQTAIRRPVDLRTWDEAFRRVESYLRAHGIESRVQLNGLATDIIAAAQRAVAVHPTIDPVTLAMGETEKRMGEWFERIFGAENGTDERFHARGRLAMIMAGGPGCWSQHFLSDHATPEEVVAAMRDSGVRAGPEVRFTNMAPRPIEFGRTDVAKNPGRSLSRGTLLRAAAMWVIIIGLLGVTWAASH